LYFEEGDILMDYNDNEYGNMQQPMMPQPMMPQMGYQAPVNREMVCMPVFCCFPMMPNMCMPYNMGEGVGAGGMMPPSAMPQTPCWPYGQMPEME
jgi:hypothetical protein